MRGLRSCGALGVEWIAHQSRNAPSSRIILPDGTLVEVPDEEGDDSRMNKDGGTMSSHQSRTTTDHNEIRRWAEARGAHPACVKGTGGAKDVGMIRLDFPGYSGGDSLQAISWDDWFRAFDENNLALVYQETTSDGERSNFNKLVARDTAEAREHGESHASRHHSGSRNTSSSASSTSSRSRGRETAAHASQSEEQSLKEREYRDEHGEIHHHTRTYMEQHGDDES